MQVVDRDPFNSDPTNPELMSSEVRERLKSGEKLPVGSMKIPMVDLPLGATEDRVCGTIDIEKALTEGVKAFEPGLLAKVRAVPSRGGGREDGGLRWIWTGDAVRPGLGMRNCVPATIQSPLRSPARCPWMHVWLLQRQHRSEHCGASVAAPLATCMFTCAAAQSAVCPRRPASVRVQAQPFVWAALRCLVRIAGQHVCVCTYVCSCPQAHASPSYPCHHMLRGHEPYSLDPKTPACQHALPRHKPYTLNPKAPVCRRALPRHAP
eukprot:365813-Chlamydomonas_euryale.AAC.1